VYVPTSAANDDNKAAFYGKLQEVMDQTPRGDIMIITGDFNAIVGAKGSGSALGKFRLGKRNEEGDKLAEFAEGNHLVIMNTCFQQPKRKLYTWTSHSGKFRNQIDYVLINRK